MDTTPLSPELTVLTRPFLSSAAAFDTDPAVCADAVRALIHVGVANPARQILLADWRVAFGTRHPEIDADQAKKIFMGCILLCRLVYWRGGLYGADEVLIREYPTCDAATEASAGHPGSVVVPHVYLNQSTQ